MKRIFIAILFLSIFIQSRSQHTNVMISDQSGPNEPTIIMNPRNTNQLVAGANLNNVYISTDGGFNWSRSVLTSDQHGVWGDPVIIVDTTQSFYYFHLSNPPSGSWIDRIVCQRLDDIDGNWNDGSAMGKNGSKAQDKQWAVVDPVTNTIYVTWTQFDDYGSSNSNDKSDIMFSKSVDRGETWTEAKMINEVSGDCIDDDNTTEGAVPTVGPNGEVYVSWAGPAGIVFDRSLDGGETWLENDIFVTNMGGGWTHDIPGIMRCNGMPVTICDISNGPNHGTIYINYADQSNGTNDTDIWLVKSTDGGNTWTAPKRVNDDPPGKHQFFTWMAIDQMTGYLYFVFYDRRNYDDNNTDVYMAVSYDGGENLTNFKISESPFLPYSSVFFGDYTNITAHNNIIRPAWCRLDQYDRSIMTAIVDPSMVGIEDYATSPKNLILELPNPIHESSFISYKLREKSNISLQINDNFGRIVATIFKNKTHIKGKYTEQFNPANYNLSPGTYYFVLQTDSQKTTQKILIIR